MRARAYYLHLDCCHEHFYARIQNAWTYTSTYVEHRLTASEARRFNDYDHFSSYEKGDRSERFWTEPAARKAAIAKFRSMTRRMKRPAKLILNGRVIARKRAA